MKRSVKIVVSEKKGNLIFQRVCQSLFFKPLKLVWNIQIFHFYFSIRFEFNQPIFFSVVQLFCDSINKVSRKIFEQILKKNAFI